ncbi:MAG: superoxide dismutase, Ni [Firmicutes bacterium]|nr:superoxide dismutase, Ni [Bacillota bacterium]
MKKKLFLAAFAVLLVSFVFRTAVFAHCEVPCGIYHDKTRVDLIREHIDTIEKSMNEITKLSKEGDKNYNQIVRWVQNKDNHADYIQEIVSQYFMTQRIKPVEPADSAEYKDYISKITLLHQMLITAMKCKQTTDLSNVEKLKKQVDDFEKLYFKDEKHTH